MNKIAVEKKHQDGYVELTRNSITQLKELLGRQDKLLNNTRFIKTLPDKGERIKTFRSKILDEIKSKENIDETSKLFSKLNLDKNFANEIEWTGKDATNDPETLDSDDSSDETQNKLKLIANHSGTQKSYQKRFESAPESLVTAQDIKDAKLVSSASSYVDQLCKKYDGKSAAERFKLHLPKQKDAALTGYKSSAEHVKDKMGKTWEVTAATPPVPVYGSTELVSLADSLSLQHNQAQRLKEILLQEAAEKLKSQSASIGALPKTNLMNYRNPVDYFEETPTQEKNEEIVEND